MLFTPFQGYPFTRDRILKEARIDIPPPLRAKVWAALLNVQVSDFSAVVLGGCQ